MLMRISLTDAGKRFNRDWIFRHLTIQLNTGSSYAIIGPNGSGKSTLLQVLSGSMQESEGKCQWFSGDDEILQENIFQSVSYCAPYFEVVEEMTLLEFFDFHQKFKSFIPGFDKHEIIKTIDLENAKDKQIRYYSSGMKQRVKLAQCIFSDTPMVLLDEPCTNLDVAGIDLYNSLINNHCKQRLVIVSSNDEVEYGFCDQQLLISDYK